MIASAEDSRAGAELEPHPLPPFISSLINFASLVTTLAFPLVALSTFLLSSNNTNSQWVGSGLMLPPLRPWRHTLSPTLMPLLLYATPPVISLRTKHSFFISQDAQCTSPQALQRRHQ